MTVFTMVTDGPSEITLPLIVVMAATPVVETEAPAIAMTVPSIVPPPSIPLMVAKLPTCQKTFFAWAPLIKRTLRCALGVPTSRVVAIWNTQKALGSP